MNIIDHFRWNLWNVLQINLFEENLKSLQPVKWLDLGTLGLRLITLCCKKLKGTWREMS